MKDKITVIGSFNYDIILKIPRLPEQGETLPADSATFSAGGKGANQAVQAAKLGIETYMAGCVGTDLMGEFLIEEAKQYGVHTDYVRKVAGSSGMGVIQSVQDGNVFAAIVRGANWQMGKDDIDRIIPLLKKTGLVILQMEIPMEVIMYAIDKAKECGCIVLLNAAPACEIKEEYLKKCDILVFNEVEASYYAKREINSLDIAKTEAKKMCENLQTDCVFTMGKEGAVAASSGKTKVIPAVSLKAVETTGAGDSFIGGIGYGLTNGMNLEDACQFAAYCSAVTIGRPGAQLSMPDLQEVEELRKKISL